MNSREAIAWFTGLALRLSAAIAFIPPLVTRLVIGQAFFLTGRGKLENLDSTVEFFAGLGIPLPELNAAFVSRLEFYGGTHGAGSASLDSAIPRLWRHRRQAAAPLSPPMAAPAVSAVPE